MPNVERITVRIIELMHARGWVVARSDTENEWTVSRGDQQLEVVLVLQPEDVRTYLQGVIADYLPHEALDSVGTSAIESELADQAHQRLTDLLTARTPGIPTEIGIRPGTTGAEIYSVRALHAKLHDPVPTLEP